MSASIVVYAFIPPLADLATDTHVFHTGWLPHARMHTVWLLGLTSSIGLLALCLLWWRTQQAAFNTHLAALLSLCVFGAFFLSALTAPLYGGELTDAVGGVEDHLLGFDINLLVFSVASLALGLGWWLCSSATSRDTANRSCAPS